MKTKQTLEKKFDSPVDEGMTTADCLNRICQKVNADGYNSVVADILADDLGIVMNRFGISEAAAVILACILERSSSSSGSDEEDLANYIGCTNIEFISFHENLRELVRAGIVCSSNNRCGKCYFVTSEAIKAIEKNADYQSVKNVNLTPDEFFSRLRSLVVSIRHGSIDAELFLDEADQLIADNQHLEFCRKMKESALYTDCRETERRMFLYLAHRYVSHSETVVEIDTLLNLVADWEDESLVRRSFMSGNTDIQKCGLVAFGIEDGFVNNETLSLSDEVKNGFFNQVTIAPVQETKHKDIVCWETIKAKDLYYNQKESEQINRLDDLLKDENFKGVQDRLEEMGMRKGFNAIFYGGPGTGKTACVYELARRTGRDIFCIDMSKLKSKWVGESEKSVKGVFSLYRSMVRDNAKAPILLFNEADAIFSKRIQNVEASVDQMNNAIQNIILQEMENIDGILIATTNLVANLDPAFERRFIFKIQFEKPGTEVRRKIWKSMITDLSDDEAGRLADEFAFSGGNIENITRKSTIDYVLTGSRPTYDSIVKYCREESLGTHKERKAIGF